MITNGSENGACIKSGGANDDNNELFTFTQQVTIVCSLSRSQWLQIK